MPIDADVKGGYGSPGNRPNDPRGNRDRDSNKPFDSGYISSYSPPTVTPDPQPSAEEVYGISPNLAEAQRVQEERFNRDNKKNKINQNAILNFFNKKIVNPYVDAMYNYGLPLSQLTPTQFGLYSLYGNIFNFNPSIDEETGEISTSLLGDTGTATFGKLNIDNYKDYQGLMNPQDFYSAAFVDPATGELYDNTNFEALKTYTDNMGAVLKDDMDLEQNLRDNMDTNKDGKIDGFDFAGDGGPADVYIPPTGGTTSGAAPSGKDAAKQYTPIDYQAIYDAFSADQKATADKIMAMDDYDFAYAVDYVRMGGPLF